MQIHIFLRTKGIRRLKFERKKCFIFQMKYFVSAVSYVLYFQIYLISICYIAVSFTKYLARAKYYLRYDVKVNLDENKFIDHWTKDSSRKKETYF